MAEQQRSQVERLWGSPAPHGGSASPPSPAPRLPAKEGPHGATLSPPPRSTQPALLRPGNPGRGWPPLLPAPADPRGGRPSPPPQPQRWGDCGRAGARLRCGSGAPPGGREGGRADPGSRRPLLPLGSRSGSHVAPPSREPPRQVGEGAVSPPRSRAETPSTAPGWAGPGRATLVFSPPPSPLWLLRRPPPPQEAPSCGNGGAVPRGWGSRGCRPSLSAPLPPRCPGAAPRQQPLDGIAGSTGAGPDTGAKMEVVQDSTRGAAARGSGIYRLCCGRVSLGWMALGFLSLKESSRSPLREMRYRRPSSFTPHPPSRPGRIPPWIFPFPLGELAFAEDTCQDAI